MWWLLIIPVALVGVSLAGAPAAHRRYCERWRRMSLGEREREQRDGWGPDYWRMTQKARLRKWPLREECGRAA